MRKSRYPECFHTLAISSLVLVFLSSCTMPKPIKKDVGIEETHIEFPEELYKQKGFKIVKATIYESGSLRNEGVQFNSGYISYTQYFLGGMLAVTPEKFANTVSERFPDWMALSPVEKVSLEIGKTYIATLYSEKDDQTCIYAQGNVGIQVELNSGPGYPGRTSGMHCQHGRKPELLKGIMPWLQGIRFK